MFIYFNCLIFYGDDKTRRLLVALGLTLSSLALASSPRVHQAVSPPSNSTFVSQVATRYNCGTLVYGEIKGNIKSRTECWDIGDDRVLYWDKDLDNCGLVASSGDVTFPEMQLYPIAAGQCKQTLLDPFLATDNTLTASQHLERIGISIDFPKLRQNNQRPVQSPTP